MQLDELEISRAYELRPGAVYVVKCDVVLSGQMRDHVGKMLADISEDAGCKFVLLEKHFDLVQPPAPDHHAAS